MPHARGDEPQADAVAQALISICPTHVGMNRTGVTQTGFGIHLPHARGDEPMYPTIPPHSRKFAPRTWG